jgi:hypothetical protein
MYIVLFIIFILILLGTLPALGLHSYGWTPSGVVAVIVIVLLILMLIRRAA